MSAMKRYRFFYKLAHAPTIITLVPLTRYIQHVIVNVQRKFVLLVFFHLFNYFYFFSGPYLTYAKSLVK